VLERCEVVSGSVAGKPEGRVNSARLTQTRPRGLGASED
jgi:hypothetical protein